GMSATPFFGTFFSDISFEAHRGLWGKLRFFSLDNRAIPVRRPYARKMIIDGAAKYSFRVRT
ncbi:MAG: hypothetical protein KDE19_24230, partial [Caldilineaceae bacterium]|nr:hypothetical protein [Caldilineaceae bacterium]